MFGSSDPRTLSAAVLDKLSTGYERDFTICYWDGSSDLPASGQTSRFRLILKHPGTVRTMFWPFNPAGLGEAYIFDDFDVDGDIFAFVAWLAHITRLLDKLTIGDKLGLFTTMLRMPNRAAGRSAAHAGKPREHGQGIEEDRRGISLHYDRPGAFYQLFLGPTMLYTCARYRTPDDDPDDAQRAKMDHICRKLRLKPGQKLLDMGCGWGGLLRHAVEHYGVTGVGVTLAGEQAKWAEAANGAAGLASRITIHTCDYRQMPFRDEFDGVSSVGMTEEVGPANLPIYLKGVFAALKPGGAYLHHCIQLRPHTPFPRWTAFARKYVFPNGHLHTLPDGINMAASAGFEVRDVENLRENYTLTLKAWVRRLEENREEAIRLTDEVTYRIYRIYMAGATIGFDAGIYQLNQTLFVKPDGGRSGVPLSRADWYAQ